MSKQVDVLLRGKRQTQGSLHSLQRRLDALDELVSSASSGSPVLPQSSIHDALNSTEPQVLLCRVQEFWVGVVVNDFELCQSEPRAHHAVGVCCRSESPCWPAGYSGGSKLL